MADRKHWVYKIVPISAFAAGVIMASIGGIMSISSVAKLYLFENGQYSYITRDQCIYDYSVVEASGDIKPKTQSDEEIKECIKSKQIEEKIRFKNSEKGDVVDGLTTLIVGLMLILFFRNKKND